jgi:nicotinamidase-related amidase
MKRREMLIGSAAVGAGAMLTSLATTADETTAAKGSISSSKTRGNDMTANKWMIDPNDAVLLLIDHQSGLFQLVRDMDYRELRNNVTALAKTAKIAKIPTVVTASVPEGANGPSIPDILQSNPNAVYVPRSGPINAWDHRPFVEAIEKTKRKTLLIAGTLTSICMVFPALSALEAGYKVFCIVDASGNWSKMATDISIARVTQAGAIPIDTFAAITEVMHTWDRPDAMEFAKVFVDHVEPAYGALFESYYAAQKAMK